MKKAIFWYLVECIAPPVGFVLGCVMGVGFALGITFFVRLLM
jgi:hypothetical protein